MNKNINDKKPRKENKNEKNENISDNAKDYTYDIILVTGDAYVDHPYFGAALIKRFLESKGFSVAVIDQPNWKSNDDFLKFGAPKLFFGVTAGNLDSMLANYGPLKKIREKENYSRKGALGKRPDRAVIVYCNKLKEAFKGKKNINDESIPLVIGGIEASLRRFAHYDYWDNAVRKSILVDSRADLLVYGMGEYASLEIAKKIKSGKKISEITDVQNTCYRANEIPEKYKIMPSFEKVKGEDIESKKLYNEAFRIFYDNEKIAQKQDDNSKFYVVQNPIKLLSTEELDYIYELPFTRESEDVPAIKSVQFSVLSHRGCFGKCSFCSIFLHQGKIIQSRSHESIKREIETLKKHPKFRGIIDDLGGPSANMYSMKCKVNCSNNFKECVDCKVMALQYDGIFKYLDLLRMARQISGVKHVFVRSGLRLDLVNKLPREKEEEYIYEICKYHVSGRLKVAPEHINDNVLRMMNKATKADFVKFVEIFDKTKRKLKKEGKNVELIPYFMAAHPGCSVKEMKELQHFIEGFGEIDQVQIFTPTPSTLSSCIYWTGMHPYTNEKVYVPYTYNEKKLQKAMMHPFKRENWDRLNSARAEFEDMGLDEGGAE